VWREGFTIYITKNGRNRNYTHTRDFGSLLFGIGMEIGALSLRRKNRKDQMEACSLIEILLYEELHGTES
jgi:hypothetical protein